MKDYIVLEESAIKRYIPNKQFITNLFDFLGNDYNAALLGGAARYMLSPNVKISPCEDLDIFSYNTIRVNFIEALLASIDSNLKFKTINGASGDIDDLIFITKTVILQPEYNNIQIIDMFSKGFDCLLETAHKPKNAMHICKILDTFDFTICKVGILPDLKCIVHKDFFEHETNRVLQIIRHSDNLIARIYKYMKLGYSLTEESYVELLDYFNKNINQLDNIKSQELLNNFIETGDPFLSDFAQDIYKKWTNSKKTLK